jgi:hypothetical protein
MTATWRELAASAPEMAAAGERLFYQFGVGLAFLATVRPDGGPRVHPMCPVLHEGGLYAFITASPKRQDLVRDGRYAMHAFGPADNDDEFYVTGRVRLLPRDDPLQHPIHARFMRERGQETDPGATSSDELFELLIERALWGVTSGHGAPPDHTLWTAQE